MPHSIMHRRAFEATPNWTILNNSGLDQWYLDVVPPNQVTYIFRVKLRNQPDDHAHRGREIEHCAVCRHMAIEAMRNPNGQYGDDQDHHATVWRVLGNNPPGPGETHIGEVARYSRSLVMNALSHCRQLMSNIPGLVDRGGDAMPQSSSLIPPVTIGPLTLNGDEVHSTVTGRSYDTATRNGLNQAFRVVFRNFRAMVTEVVKNEDEIANAITDIAQNYVDNNIDLDYDIQRYLDSSDLVNQYALDDVQTDLMREIEDRDSTIEDLRSTLEDLTARLEELESASDSA